MQTVPKIILGIDPGTVIMGYGLVAVTGTQVTIVDMGILKMSSSKDAYAKLEMIHSTVKELIVKYSPHYFAIEAPFFGKNVQSMLKLGRAQGVAIATAMHAGLPIAEYSPKKVKLSITGNGNADKEQIWQMLQRTLSIPVKPESFDATDALAVALCHHYATSLPSQISETRKGNSWSAFLKKNPGRVKV